MTGGRTSGAGGILLSSLLLTAACEAGTEWIGPQRARLTQQQIDQAVTFVVAPDAEHLMLDDESILQDAETLAQDLASMSLTLGFPETAQAGEQIIVTFTGKGEVVEPEEDGIVYAGGEPDADEPMADPELDAEFVSWDTVHIETRNEFTVEFPRALLHEAGEQAAKTV